MISARQLKVSVMGMILPYRDIGVLYLEVVPVNSQVGEHLGEQSLANLLLPVPEVARRESAYRVPSGPSDAATCTFTVRFSSITEFER